MKLKKTVTLDLGRAGGSPKDAAGTLKAKLKKGPLSKAFLRGLAKLINTHGVSKDFDIALAVRPKKDMEPSAPHPRLMGSERTLFGDLTEEWTELRERKLKKRKRKDMEEYGSPGAVIGKGGIGDPGHHPPTIGFPSS
jgi:hypothetical protein